MDSQTALSLIVARYSQALAQLEQDYLKRLDANGGVVCLAGGPLFENEPLAVAAYIEVRTWRNIERERIGKQFAVEVQVWFDCSM